MDKSKSNTDKNLENQLQKSEEEISETDKNSKKEDESIKFNVEAEVVPFDDLIAKFERMGL